MIIDYQKGIIDEMNFEKFERDNGYSYYLNGLLFMKGKKAGKETLFSLADEYERTGKVPFSKLYGAFSCIIVKENGDMVVFSDNSNMHCFYINDSAISSSFLSLIRYLKKCKDSELDFDDEAICEFYTLGSVYFGKTFLKGIRLSNSSEYFEIKNSNIFSCQKEIGGIDEQTTIPDIASFLQGVSYALSDEKTCLALTGGYDSRMLFACLNNSMEISPTIGGNNESSKDIIIAERVCQLVNKELNIVKVDKPEINESTLRDQFEVSDGMTHFINDARFRWNSFRKAKIKEGYRYHLTGDGGVLHKDWEWMQDLPFYHRKKTNIRRYYHQRIACQYKENNLGSRLIPFAKVQEANFIKKLSVYKKTINTQSYDALYNYVYGNRILSYNISTSKFSSYAPLQELDLVRYSYKLPRWERFFCNSIRKVTSKANPLIADIPTSHGTTASCRPTLIAKDSIMQIYNYFIKALRLLARKLFKKTLFIENIVTWTTVDEIRNLDVSQQALNYCIESGFIAPFTKVQNLTERQLGCLIHIYFLAKEMQIS